MIRPETGGLGLLVILTRRCITGVNINHIIYIFIFLLTVLQTTPHVCRSYTVQVNKPEFILALSPHLKIFMCYKGVPHFVNACLYCVCIA